jgi:hypothetical protein
VLDIKWYCVSWVALVHSLTVLKLTRSTAQLTLLLRCCGLYLDEAEEEVTVSKRAPKDSSGNMMYLILALNTLAMLIFGAYMIYATNKGSSDVKTEL